MVSFRLALLLAWFQLIKTSSEVDFGLHLLWVVTFVTLK